MSENAQNTVASLEVLPPEVLLPIVTSLPGLDTLWNLMTASPNTWRLFSNYALDITEGILSGPNSILYGKIRELVRGVILMRAKTLPFKDLNEFQTQDIRPLHISDPQALHASSPPSWTRSFGSGLMHFCTFQNDPIPVWDREAAGTPVKVVDGGQPSWREEMRALRAMWIIQLVGEVKGLVKEGWPEEDIDTLKQIDLVDLVERPDGVIKAEELRCAMEYLTKLGDAIQNDHYRLPTPSLDLKSHRWITAEQKPVQSPMVLVGHRHNGKLLRLGKGEPIPEGSKPEWYPFLRDDMKWHRAEPSLQRESCGISSWRSLSTSRDSPAYGVKFDSFRRLGFAFWERERLHLAGLADGIHEPFYKDEFYHFALESILPTDEVANLKAEIPEREVPRIAPRLRSRDFITSGTAPSLPASSLSTRRAGLRLSSLSTLPVSGSHETR
ncbi:hypothetical protein NW766_008794 [Fusarium irregulare]|uniref:F-box domain-containing protein n=1 Tax=Fusarium irregulare TaxID=2494466 RepID=A0A9W8U6Q9_9HYPO|nr:hypothetical protein NW766_008794 [Fusarium irregulare]